jgi:hypothetical protein
MTEMDQLREDVRATAPSPSLEFTARMDRAVERGFKEPRHINRPRLGLWAPGVALACTALVAVVVGLASIDNGGDDEGASGSAATPSLAEDTGCGGESAAAAPQPPQLDAFAGRAPDAQYEFKSERRRGRDGNRVVEQRTALELETGADDFQEVSDEVLRVADDSGSIVQSSRVSERDGKAFARYDLRVPASRLDDTLAELTRLAHVTSRSAASEDITRAYVSATDRLDDARAERDALLKALEKADTETEAEAIRRQIELARTRISVARRDVTALERRADRAKVTLTLRSTGRRTDEGGAWTPGDAVDDAGRILEVATGVVVVSAAALLPVAILGLLAGLAARTVRRRRRESALDAA